MASRWSTFHATGGQRTQYETGGYGGYRESLMTVTGHRKPTPVAHAASITSPAPQVPMVKFASGIFSDTAKSRTRSAVGVAHGEAQKGVGGVNTTTADTPQWGQGFGSRMQAFATAPSSVPFTNVPTTGTRPNPLRQPVPLQFPSPYL